MGLPGVDVVARHPEGVTDRSQGPSLFAWAGKGWGVGGLWWFTQGQLLESKHLYVLKVWEPEERRWLSVLGTQIS